ncbi:MAG: hypothetical protein ACLRG2_05715 [Pauljensenia sp.]
MAQDWTRIEGMIIGHERISVVAGELKNVRFSSARMVPSSPRLLG